MKSNMASYIVLILLLALSPSVFMQTDSLPNTSSTSTPTVTTSTVTTSQRTETRETEKMVTEQANPEFITPTPDTSRTCLESEVKYVYTPCDDNDNRWRVQVPKNPTCTVYQPEQPTAGLKCSFTCSPGEYLDINQQKCERCPPGTFSVGDGKRYAKWEKLPEDFDTKGHDADMERIDSTNPPDKCKKAVWKTKGSYLESNGSFCRSILRYRVELPHAGNISFTVKSGDESAFFHVWVEGVGTCSSSYDSNIVKANKHTEEYYSMSTSWVTHTLDLNKGHNTVYFVAAYFSNIVELGAADDDKKDKEDSSTSYESNTETSVLIKEILVRGFGYSADCAQCDAGTYSGPGSKSCTPCVVNTFSSTGAGNCIKCSEDEYAPVQSKTCIRRKPCGQNDYHKYLEACNNGMTHDSYEWNVPHICQEVGSVTLPLRGDEKKCPPCNPGLYNNGSQCLYCPEKYYNDNGQGECKKCPPETSSAPGLFYSLWNHYPGGPMHLYCLARPDSGCKSEKGWSLHGSYISSGTGHSDDAEVLMYIVVPGFTKKTSSFALTFEIDCPSDNCRLKVQSIDSGHVIHDIGVYEGQKEKNTIHYVRHSKYGTRFRILFEKKYDEKKQTFHYLTSRVKIFSIEVTNAENGGTKECESCALGGSNCITCEPGEYINGDKCDKCPRDTYILDSGKPVGIEACRKCPIHSFSEPGSTYCHSNCHISIGNPARIYNLTELAGVHIVKGPKRFTTKGYPYFHAYKVSLCGQKYTESICANNASRPDEEHDFHPIKAAVCRSTIIPDNGQELSAQSISVGEYLQSIDVSNMDNKADKEINMTTSNLVLSALNTLRDSQAKQSTKVKPHEVFFRFHSNRITSACENGTFGTVRLVCDPRQPGKGKIHFGNDVCEAETCDGCNYVFTWKSMYACAECTVEDYETIVTACQKGKKTTRYVWRQPQACIGGIKKPIDVETECSIFEKSILDFKVVIMGFFVGAVILGSVVIFLCYRNRSLSYKYHRLVDAGQSRDGELPSSEKCALEDGEEEEEEVILSRGKGGSKILDRIKGLAKGKKSNFSEFETINLDSMKGYSDDDDDDI